MIGVIGIGDNVVDHYIHTNTMYPGGNALNVAVYTGMLGARSAFLGVFGTDYPALHLQSTLRNLGVDISRCRVESGENGCAKVNIVDGDRVFVGTNRCGVLREHPLKLDQDDLAYIKRFDIAHSSVNSYLEEELRAIKETGILLSYDFSQKGDEAYYQKVCPYVDFAVISCGHLDRVETEKKMELIFDCGSRYVIATMGSRGALFYDGERWLEQPVQKVDAVDTLGAGDSFFAAFLMSYAGWLRKNGRDCSSEERFAAFADALEAGSRFAAKVCMEQGAFGYGAPYRGGCPDSDR